jgi:dimethylhistidine N-methyltransferase
MSLAAHRVRLVRLGPTPETADDGHDIASGLMSLPRTLPCRYFYDSRGSDLFEIITSLPEYYPTRTEASILEARADELVEITGPCELVELGAGSSRKTRLLIDAYLQKGRTVHFRPVDVSESALAETAQILTARYEELSIEALLGTYEQGFAALGHPREGRRMMIFLGSTIGNFDEDETHAFLNHAANASRIGDYFLIGFDRVKDKAVIEAAYNDSQGVTAAFNYNLLRHVNRRFGANFDLGGFVHEAPFVAEKSQIEMRLVSRQLQRARVPEIDVDIRIAKGEFIRTEISRKFEPADIIGPAERAGFALVEEWSDPQQWFTVALFRYGQTSA